MQYNDIISSLQKLIYRKPTQQEIADILGVGQTAINGRAKRNSDFSDEEIRKIENHYNVIILSGNIISIDDCIGLPVRGNLSASMGYGIEIYDETQTSTYYIDSRLLKALGANPNTTDWVPCEGDSMSPTIEGGALLLVDKSKIEVLDGKIYCVRLNNQLLAKRLQFIPPNSVKVISDNKEKYDAFYVDFSKELDYDFAIIGEVKHWINNAR